MCEEGVLPDEAVPVHERGKPLFVGDCFGKTALAKTNVQWRNKNQIVEDKGRIEP